jgi:hypothetical protein
MEAAMSALGKVLILFNLLAAAAFAYFTLQNWKVRKELSWASIERDVRLKGLPVEFPEKPPTGLDKDRVPFKFEGPNSNHIDSIEKERLNKLIPNGGDFLGGEPVADQSAEVKRLQEKVFGTLKSPGENLQERFRDLRVFLLNLSRSGADRDGVNGLFDLLDPNKQYLARRDVPYLARSASQVAALKTLVDVTDLGDPQGVVDEAVRNARIAGAKHSIRRFALGETEGGKDTEEGRRLQNAVIDLLDGKGQRDAVTGEFQAIGEAAAEPLTDKPSVDRAAAALAKYAQGKAGSPAETATLGAVVTLINPPVAGFNLNATIDTAATNRLTQYFEEAAKPAKDPGNSTEGKARRIAHLLYHIDSHRYNVAAAAADRKAWHERVATIIGLPEYVRTAEAQASEYAEAGQRLVSAITEEESTFRAEYETLLQRVLFLYTQWLALDTQFNEQKAITDKNETLRAERLTERDELQKQLTKAREDAKEALARLTDSQKRLFTIQTQLRDAQEAILSLEKELRKIEGVDTGR